MHFFQIYSTAFSITPYCNDNFNKEMNLQCRWPILINEPPRV